ncbi:MAG TPA: FAD-binding oxidoreductase, partial [Micrococcaceae bacterium]
WLMANTLVNLERGLYDAVGLSPDTVWRSWRLAERIRETADVTTFVVERTDERDVKPSLPGQYVTLQMPVPDGAHQPRQYSLTRADDGHHRWFAVKRVQGEETPDGEVSNLLIDTLKIGDEVILSAPFGDVVLDTTERPVVFASAGIGVTPMAGMISHLAQSGSGRRILFLHTGTSPDSFALRDQVRSDLESLPHAAMITWYERGMENRATSGAERSGFMDATAVDLPADAVYYLCGPLAFMQVVRQQLLGLGVAPRDIQYEVFGPDLWQADYE